MACATDLLRLGTGATDLGRVAERLVRSLHGSLNLSQSEEPRCPLVRLYKTVQYHRLAPELRRAAASRLGKVPDDPSLRCMTLLASAGDVPGWTDPTGYSACCVIPVGSRETLEHSSPYGALFDDIAGAIAHSTAPSSERPSGSHTHTFSIVHVLQDGGNPSSPAREDWIGAYDIRSALAFGAPLPDEEWFSIVLFSRDLIPERTAQMFKPLAISAQIALSPYVETTPWLQGPAASLSVAHDAHAPQHATVTQLQARIDQFERLLDLQERTVTLIEGRYPLNDGRESDSCMAGTVPDGTDSHGNGSPWQGHEETMGSVFEQTSDGIIVVDEHGRIERINPAVGRLLGYAGHELVGRNLTLLVPSSHRKQYDLLLSPDPGTGQRTIPCSSGAVPALRKDGTTVDLDVSITELQVGSSRKYAGILRDLSGRACIPASMGESEERFRQLAEHIDAVFWLRSVDKHQLLYINRAFETIWGRSLQALHADPQLWLECVHPEDRERVALAAACQSYLPYDEEYRILTPHGHVRWIRDRGFPIKDQEGRVYRLAGIAVDITAAKQLETAVRVSETRYRSLVELSPTAVFVNCDGRMAFANQACANLLGARTPAELTGRQVFDFIHPDSRALVQARLAAMSATGRAVPRIEENFYRLDGSSITVEVTASPVPFEGKNAFLIIATDVTERKHLEQALLSTNSQLMGILSAARRVAIIATDTTGLITTFNTGAELMLGYSAEEMVGNHSPGLLHLPTEMEQRGRELSTLCGRPVGGFDVLVEPARRDAYDEREWTYVRKDGTRLTVLVTITALRNEGDIITGFLLLGKDVTERKETEAALLQAARDMGQKNIELAKARDEALQAVQLKADFLATMSHEIRTPMNAIIGMTGLLLDTTLTDDQREFADTVRRSSDALLTLVNDILDFSKIEAGKLHFETLAFDLRTTIEDTLDLLAEQAQIKGLELISLVDAAVPAGVLGDPGRLRQILVNLVANAIKFTAKGEVFLRVTPEPRGQPDSFRFAVMDTGIGIPEAMQARLFQPFTQADSSTTRRFGGTGLGLTICQRLVHQMQGRIGIESQPGQGSTFWFTATLPEASLPLPSAAISRPQLRGRRILVMDRHATTRQAVRQLLVDYGMDCTEAETGTEALELARTAAANQQPYDVALIELRLPGMEGCDTATGLKNEPATARTRTVALTTIARRGEASTGQLPGLDASLTKPLRQKPLLDCLCLLVGAPIGESAQTLAPPPVTQRAPVEAKTLVLTRALVAEDNPVNQKVACRMLEKLGCRVDIVGTGREAVAAHERTPYPLIFMDCQMPEMDGFEATALIRKIEGASAHTPIIAMTANAMKGDREKCLAAGMDDYVAKPIRPKDLQTILDAWLPKRNQTAA